MNSIDQRVLIPAPPTIIWNVVSQIENNPSWQVDCRSINFLTSKQEGRGMRWRQMSASGREYIMEVTAWYDLVGYEYRVVDGGPFREALGRIKLHETPDGTIVHWEFLYEIGGFMSGLRNSLVTRRNLENLIADSLWALWEISNQAKRDQPVDYVYRSLMREAPDVQSRAQYMEQDSQTFRPPDSTSPGISEPPIKQDDTRPGTAEPAPATTQAPAVIETVDAVPVMEDSPSEQITAEQPLELAYLEDDHEDVDTSEVSVFDLFGVKPPGDSEESATPVSSLLASKSTQEPWKIELQTGRSGLRSQHRRRLAKIRRPQ